MRKLSIVAVLAIAAGGVGACSSSAASSSFTNGVAGRVSETTGVVHVVAAENVWGDIARQLGGPRVEVISLITNPNQDPHEFSANLTDAAALQNATVVIENGAGYDNFMTDLLSSSDKGGRAVLDVSKLVGLRGANPNPHLWYDPTYVLEVAAAIEGLLAQASPANATTFATNLATFTAGENQVSAVIAQIKARHAGQKIAYTERVAGYLVDAAGLVLGTPASFAQAIEDGNDPTPADSAAFESALRTRAVRVLLYNAQVTDTETTHLRGIAISAGIPVVGMSETLPPGLTFQTWQLDQAKTLQRALDG